MPPTVCHILYRIYVCHNCSAYHIYTMWAETILVWENVIWVDLSVNHFSKLCNPRNGNFLHSNLEAIVCGYVCVCSISAPITYFAPNLHNL